MLTNENLHYLDNAATTIPSPEVVAAVSKSLAENWANPSSLYTPGLENAQLLNRCRATGAKTLGCTAAEVYFTGCGSESNNIALLGAAHTRQNWGRRIVVSGFEHPSVQLPLRRLAEEGFEVIEVPPEKDGHLDVEKMAGYVNKGTILVACMLVNNELGTRVDTEKLAKLVKTANPRTAVHIDAVQGWMRVPFRLDNIDSLAVSGHKIHAPKGVGALFLRKGYSQGMKLPLLGGGQEKGVRPGTENIAYAVGLAAAAQQMQAGFAQRTEHLAALNRRAGDRLVAERQLFAPGGEVRPGARRRFGVEPRRLHEILAVDEAVVGEAGRRHGVDLPVLRRDVAPERGHVLPARPLRLGVRKLPVAVRILAEPFIERMAKALLDVVA